MKMNECTWYELVRNAWILFTIEQEESLFAQF